MVPSARRATRTWLPETDWLADRKWSLWTVAQIFGNRAEFRPQRLFALALDEKPPRRTGPSWSAKWILGWWETGPAARHADGGTRSEVRDDRRSSLPPPARTGASAPSLASTSGLRRSPPSRSPTRSRGWRGPTQCVQRAGIRCRAAGPRRPDCVAGHVGLELRYVVTKYPFESRAGFPRI